MNELFETPYSPSPALLDRQREGEVAKLTLELVKTQYGILTHCDHGSETPWLAVGTKHGETRDIATLMAEEGRYLEEAGYTNEADTEANAVLGLIQQHYPKVTCLGDVPAREVKR